MEEGGGMREEGRVLCDQLFTGGVDDGEREYDYLRWLPEIYRDEIPREGQRLLQEIKEGLVTCLATHEKSLFTHYAKELNYYLDLKYELSVEDRLVLIRLLLQLVLIPEQAMSLVTAWADVLDRLLSKRRLRLEERLKVPWRPFYELLRPHFVHQKTVQKPDITRINHARFLLALIKTLKRFWKEEATEEIMAEFRPYFCALDSQFGDAIGFITLFLPTNADTSICKLWLEECFALWEWFDHSPNLTYMWLDLFANLAEDQAGRIDLSPYYSRFLTIFLTLIDIPVGSTAFPAPKAVSFGNDVFFGWESDHSKKKYGLGSVSGIIVYCLSPTSPMQESLDKLLHILEPYYHPSNDGPWVRNLALFLSSLCFHFARRVGQELDERTCRTPIAHRLGPEERQRFVRCLQPIVMKALLSKREVMAAQAQRALKSLASVCPEIVVPEVIESTFHDLTTLTETHRTQSALETLSMLARPLLWRRHYPAGASHLQTLLFLTLPGIDANDPHKTAATLNFYLDLLGSVPLINSTALVDDKSVNEWDKAVIQATGFFANWTLEFLDRVFTILTLQGDSFDKGSSKTLDIEGSISLIIVITTQFLFQQASDEIHELALDHIYRFVFSSMPMHSLKYVADMVTAATTGKAKKALSMFIPRLHTLLVYDQDDSSKWLSVSELRWYLRITAAVVRVAAEELLPFRNQLIDILTNTLQHNDKQVFKSAGKLLRYTLQVLTTVYQVEKRSVPPALWSSSYFAQNHWKYWGEPNELDKLDMQWNIPSGASLSFGNELVNLFCYPALTRLQEIISPSTDSSSSPPQKKHKNVTNSTQQSSPSTASSTTSSKGSFLRDLYLVMNVVRSYVHPEYGQTVHSTSASGIEMRRHSPYIGEDVLWARLEEDPSYHRSKVTLPQIRDLLHKLLVHLMECREDEITAICTAVKIVKKLFKNGPKSNKVLAGYQFYRDRIRDRVRGRKQHPRWIHVSRVNILHLQRMGMQRFDMKPYLSILDDLFHLSLHSYRQVRRKTQPIYLQLLRRSDANVKKEHAIRCLKVLDSAESTTAQAKGACHLARRFLNRMTGSWILVKQFCFSFCRTFHHDEPKLQALLTELIALFEVNLSGPTIQLLPLPSLQPDPSLIELAQKVGCELPSLECIQHCREVQSQKVQKNITLWNETINTLLEFTATPSLHWKYEISAAVLLALFIRDDAKPTAANYSSMMEFFAKRAISEIQGLRITSLKAMASLLWIYKRQRRRVYHNDSFQKQSHQRLLQTIQHMDQPLSLEEWHHSFFLDKNYLGWMGIVAPKKNFSYREGFLRPSITTTTTSLSLSTTTFTQDHQTKVIIDSEPEKEKEERDEEEGSNVSSKDMEWNESFMLEKEEADTLNAYFASVDYWQTFMSRYKDQQRHENKIGFSRDSASLFKRLFQRYWDRFFDAIKPQLETLCADTEQRGSQCVAAEIVAGLIRGSKHWHFESYTRMWDYLKPLLQKTLYSSPTDCIADWCRCLRIAVADRDPRRFHPLIECLVEEPPVGSTANVKAKRFRFLETLMSEICWRYPQLNLKVLDILKEQHLESHHQIVRKIVSSLLATIYRNCWKPFPPDEKRPVLNYNFAAITSTSSMSLETEEKDLTSAKTQIDRLQSFLHDVLSRIEEGKRKGLHREDSLSLTLLPSSSEQNSNGVQRSTQNNQTEEDMEEEEDEQEELGAEGIEMGEQEKLNTTLSTSPEQQKNERLAFVDLCRTLADWMSYSLRNGFDGGVLPYIHRLLPALFDMYKDSDMELSNSARIGLGFIANTVFPPQYLTDVVQVLETILTQSEMWRIRALCLPILQVVVFHHIFILSEETLQRIMDTTIRLLSDSQLEVRELASTTLTGILKFVSKDHMLSLKETFEELSTTNPWCSNASSQLLRSRAARERGEGQRSRRPRTVSGMSNENTRKFLQRHGGVLGMAAIVSAYPYTIPPWMPELLVTLAKHVDDPLPISASVKKTFLNFWRTHQDAFHLFKPLFSEDQLFTLTELLVAPTYFA